MPAYSEASTSYCVCELWMWNKYANSTENNLLSTLTLNMMSSRKYFFSIACEKWWKIDSVVCVWLCVSVFLRFFSLSLVHKVMEFIMRSYSEDRPKYQINRAWILHIIHYTNSLKNSILFIYSSVMLLCEKCYKMQW